MDDTRFI